MTSSVGVAIYVWAWPSRCGRGHCGSRRCSSQRLAGIRVVDAGVNPALVTIDVGDDDGLRLHEAVVLSDDPAQQPFAVLETRGHAAPVKLQERGKQFINPQLIGSGKQAANPQLIASRSSANFSDNRQSVSSTWLANPLPIYSQSTANLQPLSS